MKKRLFDQIKEYDAGKDYPFHMPGHKRVLGFFHDPYSIDITEIYDFDNLHHPSGILKESMEEAATLYGAENSYYLVNGTTCGLLAALAAVTEIGDCIYMDRSCHKAVYHGVISRDLRPVYFYKECSADADGNVIMPQFSLEIPEDCKAVVITSPTYEGIMIPLEELVKKAHEKGIPVIVDEAHGAHLPFYKQGQFSALFAGADVVVESLHKTLPSLTQTSILHVQGDLVSPEAIQRELAVYESSSPSYVLMASIDACIGYLQQHPQVVNQHATRMEAWRREVEKLPYVWLLHGDFVDPSRLIFAVEGYTGSELMEILRDEFSLEMEMCSRDYVVAITTFCDTEEGLQRLKEALILLNERARKRVIEEADFVRKEKIPVLGVPWKSGRNQAMLSPYEATRKRDLELVEFSQAQGRICGEMLMVYPPGIPFFVPGEILDARGIEQVLNYVAEGFEVQGLHQGKIKVVVEKG